MSLRYVQDRRVLLATCLPHDLFGVPLTTWGSPGLTSFQIRSVIHESSVLPTPPVPAPVSPESLDCPGLLFQNVARVRSG